MVAAVVAVVAVVGHVVAMCVAVRVRGLRRGAGVLRRAQRLLAGRSVGVAGGHHGRGHGLLGGSEYLRGRERTGCQDGSDSFCVF